MQVFVPQKVHRTRGLPVISTRSGINSAAGDIGIEIEVEGKRLPQVGIPVDALKSYPDYQKFWSYHHDGSLRGEENAEYVLKKPVKFSQVPEALDTLWRVFAEAKSVIDDSNRTSVHVHLNCQQFHSNRLTALLTLYITFEEILTAWCGDHRVGNLFCLRAKDAPGMLHNIKTLIQNDFAGQIPESLHYSGMNVHALAKYGSLEFRSLRGTQDAETILQWCQVLQRLYDLSAEFKDPREICYLFSGEGPVNFFHNVLGDCSDFIRQGVPFSEGEIRNSMYEGIRLAQDICYCRDWSAYEEVSLTKDPFGRSQKKVLAGLDYYAMEEANPVQQVPYDAVLEQPGFNPSWSPPPLSAYNQTLQPMPVSLSNPFLDNFTNSVFAETYQEATEPDDQF